MEAPVSLWPTLPASKSKVEQDPLQFTLTFEISQRLYLESGMRRQLHAHSYNFNAACTLKWTLFQSGTDSAPREQLHAK